MSDIEGKAVQGNSERVWETNEFQSRRPEQGTPVVVDLICIRSAVIDRRYRPVGRLTPHVIAYGCVGEYHSALHDF